MAENKAKQSEKKTTVEKPTEAKKEANTSEVKPQNPQQNGSATTGFIVIGLLILGIMFIFGWGPFSRSDDHVGEAVDLKGLTVSEACTKAKEKGWNHIYVTVWENGGGDHQGDCDGDTIVSDFELDSGYCWGVNASTEYEHNVCLKTHEGDTGEDKKDEPKDETAENKTQDKSETTTSSTPPTSTADSSSSSNSSSTSSTSSSSSSSPSSSSSSSSDEYTIPSSELYTGLAACARALTNQGYNNVNMPASSYVRGYTAGEPYKWYIVTKPTYKDKTFGSNIQLTSVVCLYDWKTGDAKITYINK